MSQKRYTVYRVDKKTERYKDSHSTEFKPFGHHGICDFLGNLAVSEDVDWGDCFLVTMERIPDDIKGIDAMQEYVKKLREKDDALSPNGRKYRKD
jgi:hypothetical protein